MLRIPGRSDPLLARPLAVYDTFTGEADRLPSGPTAGRRFVDFLYLVHGKFTTALQDIGPGNELIVWGPLGNGFAAAQAADHLILVAGGIGQTALLAFGRERLGGGSYGSAGRSVPRARRVTLCWGSTCGSPRSTAPRAARAPSSICSTTSGWKPPPTPPSWPAAVRRA
jgi:dihydroorotate dehydrogenase electron transfer subunit